jgi:hypothetical protein
MRACESLADAVCIKLPAVVDTLLSVRKALLRQRTPHAYDQRQSIFAMRVIS